MFPFKARDTVFSLQFKKLLTVLTVNNSNEETIRLFGERKEVLSTRVTTYVFPLFLEIFYRVSCVIGDRFSADCRIFSTVSDDRLFPRLSAPMASRRSEE